MNRLADGDKIEILEAHLEDGDVIHGTPSDEQLQEADSVFYSVEVHGETFHRWVSGPFEDISDAYAAIKDDSDFYSDVA